MVHRQGSIAFSESHFVQRYQKNSRDEKWQIDKSQHNNKQKWQNNELLNIHRKVRQTLNQSKYPGNWKENPFRYEQQKFWRKQPEGKQRRNEQRDSDQWRQSRQIKTDHSVVTPKVFTIEIGAMMRSGIHTERADWPDRQSYEQPVLTRRDLAVKASRV